MANINKSLVTLEVLQFPPEIKTEQQIEDYYNENTTTKTFLIEDTTVPYVIRISTSDKRKLKSLDPEFLPDSDSFEVSESIQEILKEEDFPIYSHKFPEEETEASTEESKSPKKTIIPDMKNDSKSLGDIFGGSTTEFEITEQVDETIQVDIIPSNVKTIPVIG